MNELTIVLTKRKFKAVIYHLVAFFFTLLIITTTIDIITDFNWWILIFDMTLLIGNWFVCKSLIEYHNYGAIYLTVKVEKNKIQFFNTNKKGNVFNESETINLTKIERLYITQKTSRHLIKTYSYTFIGSKDADSTKENINAFPELFETTKDKREAILHFIKEHQPSIILGYNGFF